MAKPTIIICFAKLGGMIPSQALMNTVASKKPAIANTMACPFFTKDTIP
jgi:hypothetical protein